MNRNRFSFLALPVSLLALVACSSNDEASPQPSSDAAPDTIPMDAGADAAPDTVPTDTAVDTPSDTAPITKPEGWDTDYALPGLMGDPTAQVSAMVVTAKRWVYVGGNFHHAGDVAANNIAVWNGAKWNALGDGLPGEVISLAANVSDEVFAVVRKSSDYIVYQWDKSKWIDLTAQPDDQIKSVDVGADGSVWIAGFFSKLGTTSIRGVARRKDGVWSAVGALGDHPLETVRATPTGACVGGSAQPEGIGVSCWNGTTWQARKSNLLSGSVKTLRLDSKGDLVIGGQFAVAPDGGDSPGSIARWNSVTSKWDLVGGGVTGALGGPGDVTGVAVHGDNVYVTGRIANAGGINVRHIALWNGKKWFDLDGGLAKPYGLTWSDAPLGDALAIDDGGEVYVGGKLTRAGSRNAMYLAHYNGTSWSPVDDPKAIRRGINGPANTIAVSDDGKTAYVGGGFSYVGGDVHASNIGKLDQLGWHALGAGLNDAVTGVTYKDGNVYAAGHFTGSGSTGAGDPVIAAKHIAMWNGTAWSGIGGGVDAHARVIAFAPDGKMWVGGDFETAGTVTASRIAIYDGKWTAVGAGLSDGLSTRVAAIVFLDGKVYVGGDFGKSGDKTIKNIAMWDGTTWSALGDGLDRAVDSLSVYGGKLVAGGAFAKSGEKEMRHLAVWDGTTWTELGGGLPPGGDFGSTVLVQSIGVRGTELFVTGLIDKAGTTKVSHLAKWNGTEWSSMNGGLNDVGEDLFVSNDSLWVAGAFSGVAKTPSIGIARYWFAK